MEAWHEGKSVRGIVTDVNFFRVLIQLPTGAEVEAGPENVRRYVTPR